MADYFMQLKQFDKAVDLLAAIDRVCSDWNHGPWLSLFFHWTVTRSMKQLTWPFATRFRWQKNYSSDWVLRNVWHILHQHHPIFIRTVMFSLATNEDDMPQYRATCEKLGDLAANQGAYAGAAKKYLDAGNKIKVGQLFPYDISDCYLPLPHRSPCAHWYFRAMSSESLSSLMLHATAKSICLLLIIWNHWTGRNIPMHCRILWTSTRKRELSTNSLSSTICVHR